MPENRIKTLENRRIVASRPSANNGAPSVRGHGLSWPPLNVVAPARSSDSNQVAMPRSDCDSAASSTNTLYFRKHATFCKAVLPVPTKRS